jgi:hypothetical protein
VRFDAFTEINNIVANPARFGLNDVTTACIQPNVPPFQCRQPDRHLFWDWHPSDPRQDMPSPPCSWEGAVVGFARRRLARWKLPLSRQRQAPRRLDLPGAGQVRVVGNYAYVGHLPNRAQLGTSILDVSDPRKPRVVSQIHLEDPRSHSHKARVVGDLMFVNSEQNGPNRQQADLQAQAEAYDGGGFRIYDVSIGKRPRWFHFQRTGGRGVHRFDVDARYAYISTEMAGYVGNILVIYDLRDPARPGGSVALVAAGQYVAGGEKPHWPGRRNRLHHALRFGDRLWAGCWHGGLRVIDISDIRAPRTVGEYNYHPPFPEPSHTFMPVPFASAGARSRWRSTRRTTRTAPPRWSAGAAVRTLASGCWMLRI